MPRALESPLTMSVDKGIMPRGAAYGEVVRVSLSRHISFSSFDYL